MSLQSLAGGPDGGAVEIDKPTKSFLGIVNILSANLEQPNDRLEMKKKLAKY